MTKQEQIEEISNIIAEVAFVQAHEENGDENLSDIVATALYNAGYRKAEEVLKETAKEILDEIDNALHDLAMCYAKGHKDYYAVCEYVHLKIISKIAKKYSVEAEE